MRYAFVQVDALRSWLPSCRMPVPSYDDAIAGSLRAVGVARRPSAMERPRGISHGQAAGVHRRLRQTLGALRPILVGGEPCKKFYDGLPVTDGFQEVRGAFRHAHILCHTCSWALTPRPRSGDGAALQTGGDASGRRDAGHLP